MTLVEVATMANRKMARSGRSCKHCGASPISGYKYCSVRCRNQIKEERRHPNRRSMAEIQAAAVTNTDHTCVYCGGTFQPKRSCNTKFCSRECGHALQKARARLCRPVRYVVERNQCEDCGERFTARTAGKSYCSTACASRASNRARTEAKRYARVCPECNTTFIPVYGNAHRRFCSKPCLGRHMRRIRRSQERARLRAVTVEPVNPVKVFERDGWRCQLCGVRTPQRLRGTYEPKAPEMDHIVPLASGGEHSYRNCQCACRKCNGEKSDGVRGQLLLFG